MTTGSAVRRPVLLLALAVLGPGTLTRPLSAQLRVVTTTTDLAAIARDVGGARVEVRSIALGTQDPHYVEPKPSFLLELRRADAFALIGLDLEVAWAPLLLDQARNPRIQRGGAGYIDGSTVVDVRDVPVGRVTRAEGDIHPFGNPHYWLDPENGRRLAALLAERFTALDPGGAAEYETNRARFDARLVEALTRWRRDLAPFAGAPVVAYHTSWAYFIAFARLDVVGWIEPKPGIPPSAAHLSDLIAAMRARQARVVIVDPFYDPRTARSIAERAGALPLVLPSSVGGAPGTDDYIALIDHNVRSIIDALRR